MVYQMPCPGTKGVFAASSVAELRSRPVRSCKAGRQEMATGSPRPTRTFTVMGANSSRASGCCWNKVNRSNIRRLTHSQILDAELLVGVGPDPAHAEAR